MSLSTGCIRQMSQSEAPPDPLYGQPTLQVLDVKLLKSEAASAAASHPNQPPTPERYRLLLSDGMHYMQGMPSSQINPLIQAGNIKPFTIIKVKNCVVNVVKTRRVLIILELDVVAQTEGQIGDPQDVEAQIHKMEEKKSSPTSFPTHSMAPSPPSYLQRSAPAPSFNSSTGPIASFGNSGISTALSTNQFHPISSLNPYQSRWCIKARVTAKSPIKEFGKDKPTGGGKLFSIDLLDAQGGQIRCTMFKDAVDKFYNVFQVDKVYLISKGQLKLANKQFSRFDCEYEITLNSDAEVQYVGDDDGIVVPTVQFSNIEHVASVNPNEFVDIIGVVSQVSPLANIVAKQSHKQLTKRTITLVDKTLNSIELTLWGAEAEKYNEQELSNNPIMAIRGCKVSDFNGRTLSTGYNSEIYINPDRPESHELKGWWDSQGHSASIDSLSKKTGGGGGGFGGQTDQRKTFSAIKDENLGMKDKPDYFTVRGTITYFRKDWEKPPWYAACPNFDTKANRECGRKVTGQDGAWHCVHCNMDFPTMTPRFVLSVMASDATGAQWLSAFNSEAEAILGKTAAEMFQMKEQENKAGWEHVFAEASFKSYIIKLRASFDKQTDQQQEIKVRCHILGVQPIDYKQEAKTLLAEIEKY